MDALEGFAELARHLFAVLMDGAERTLEARVLEVHGALAGLLAAGSALPVGGKVPAQAPDGSPFEALDWPGFGSYERYWSVGELAEPGPPAPVGMSEALGTVAAGIWSGLEAWEAGDTARALGAWGHGYELGWGPAAAELLLALHPRVAAYRQDARGQIRSRRQAPPPTLLSSGPRPALGVRFAPCVGGVEVLAVHPGGPASGSLRAGDVVLTVDGVPLDALDAQAAGELLVGPVGQLRTYEVLRADGRIARMTLISVELGSLG